MMMREAKSLNTDIKTKCKKISSTRVHIQTYKNKRTMKLLILQMKLNKMSLEKSTKTINRVLLRI